MHKAHAIADKNKVRIASVTSELSGIVRPGHSDGSQLNHACGPSAAPGSSGHSTLMTEVTDYILLDTQSLSQIEDASAASSAFVTANTN